MWLNFYIFVDFPVFLLLLFLASFHFVQKKYFAFNFLFFKYLFCGLTFSVFWRIFHMYLRRMCILLLFGEVFSIRPNWSVLFKSSVSLLIFCIVVLSFIESTAWSLLLILGCCLFLQFYQSLFYAFESSDARCTYIYNCYILLVDWPFYHYMLFFICYNNLWLKIYSLSSLILSSA